MNTTENSHFDTEFAIVGGGIVGLSVAYGLARLGKQVVVLDEGDNAFRASRGNFGLVWVQGKGASQPAYARWTRRSAKLWPDFAHGLEEQTGLALSLSQQGGFSYYLTEEALHAQAQVLSQLRSALGGEYPFEVLGHNALRREEPGIGPTVAGGILHHEDGHLNSLMLLQALAIAVRQHKVVIRNRCSVEAISPASNGFLFRAAGQEIGRSAQVVLCAGLGALKLGSALGFSTPIRPQRGQVLITEKMPRIMHRPSDVIRQVNEGGVQIGASAEEVGFDSSETLPVTAQLAADAVTLFPQLEQANLLRSWGALRIMSPDGLPIYQQSSLYPGASFVTCHSGITLAAAHACLLPLWLTLGEGAPDLSVFSEGRFYV